MVKELPACIAILWVNNYHPSQDIELYLIHVFQSFIPIAWAIFEFHLLEGVEEMLVQNVTLLHSYD